jgi:hypothetical protein
MKRNFESGLEVVKLSYHRLAGKRNWKHPSKNQEGKKRYNH